MKYIISQTHDPYFNLAMEEYYIKNIKDDIFFLYQNQSCVIIGKNQNPHTEIGIDYIKNYDILLVRRLSGGGAVYQDLGNINYGFILQNKAKDLYNFKKYCQPIIDVLNSLNLNVEFTGRNDLVIDNHKISGTAQYISGNNLLHHGSILYNTDFSNFDKILLVNDDKLKSKGVKSVKSRVGNIKNFLQKDISLETIRDLLIKNIPDQGEYIPTSNELAEINKIATKKRETITFILENKKTYSNQCVEYIPGFGTIEVYSNVINGKISELEIFGEYFFKADLTNVKKTIVGISFEKEAITKFINNIVNFKDLFYRLKKEKLVSLIMGEH